MSSVILFLLAFQAFVAPSSQLATGNPFLLNGTIGSYQDVRCYAGPSYLYKSDCPLATKKFPLDRSTDPHPTTFSRTASDSRFRLPQAEVSGSCLVIADIAPLLPEESTWIIIKKMAGFVYKKCVVNGAGAGGESTWGTYDGLTVSIQSVRRPSNGKVVSDDSDIEVEAGFIATS